MVRLPTCAGGCAGVGLTSSRCRALALYPAATMQVLSAHYPTLSADRAPLDPSLCLPAGVPHLAAAAGAGAALCRPVAAGAAAARAAAGAAAVREEVHQVSLLPLCQGGVSSCVRADKQSVSCPLQWAMQGWPSSAQISSIPLAVSTRFCALTGGWLTSVPTRPRAPLPCSAAQVVRLQGLRPLVLQVASSQPAGAARQLVWRRRCTGQRRPTSSSSGGGSSSRGSSNRAGAAAAAACHWGRRARAAGSLGRQ